MFSHDFDIILIKNKYFSTFFAPKVFVEIFILFLFFIIMIKTRLALTFKGCILYEHLDLLAWTYLDVPMY